MTVEHKRAPLSDSIIVAVAHLVDDALTGTREPSHSEIEFQIDRADLSIGDPNRHGQILGKAKRVRATLSWAIENAPEKGEILIAGLVAHIRGCGGFRESSTNFVGAEAVKNAQDAFSSEGFELSTDGELLPVALDGLAGKELTDALKSYVRRARRGIKDAALVTGTGKDLLEATAAHVLKERYGTYAAKANFPTLLGQAFVAVGLATPQESPKAGEPPQRRMERSMYELGCAINHLRNKEGTGHGRPWLPSVSEAESKIVVELMGAIAERLLLAHEGKI